MQVYILSYPETFPDPRETWPHDGRRSSSIARHLLGDPRSLEPNALDEKMLEIEIAWASTRRIREI